MIQHVGMTFTAVWLFVEFFKTRRYGISASRHPGDAVPTVATAGLHFATNAEPSWCRPNRICGRYPSGFD